MSVKKLIAGKHTCVGRLSAGESGLDATSDSLKLEKGAVLVYCGSFQSMDGPVEITEEHLDKLMESHNSKIDELLRVHGTHDKIVHLMPPLQLDHSTSALHTVGRVTGKLLKGEHINESGNKVPALLAEKVLVLGKENTEKVADGRWCNVSIGADLEAGTLNELSITPFPAAPGAGLRLNKGEPMHEKLKKHLMEHHKMSSEDAEKMAGKMREHLTKHMAAKEEEVDSKMEGMSPDECKKLMDDMDEHDKKMAASAKEDEDHKEMGKKMTAAKSNIVKMSKELKANLSTARLALKKAELKGKVAALRASAKVTPAEIKKINFDEMAKMDDKALGVVLKAYDDREPVIDASVRGTTRAVNLAKLKKESEKAALEVETRMSLGMPLTDEQKRLAQSQGEAVAPVQAASKDADGDHDGDEYMKHLGGMLGEHEQKDAIMSHVKKMMDYARKMKAEDPGHPEEEVAPSVKEMSALAENVNKLQTQFQDLIKLVGDASGIESADLEG